ncbi:MAG: hypothetical protein GY711_32080 [bacterium]|nr:hypothetical protein [bacterium]
MHFRLRLAVLLVLVGAGPLAVEPLRNLAFSTPEWSERANFAASEGGPVDVLYTWHDIRSLGSGASAIAPAGDVDGDGHDDFALIAPDLVAYRGGTFSLRSGANGETLFRWRLPDRRRQAYAVEKIGDHDGDGVPDFLIGQGTDDSWLSRVYWICSGRKGKTLIDFQSKAVIGSPVMHTVGDLTGDGLADVFFELSGMVCSSATGGGFEAFGPDAGRAASAPGFDVDGDGHTDLAVVRPLDQPDPGPGLYIEIVPIGSAGEERGIIERFAPSDPAPSRDAPVVPHVVGDVDGDGTQDLAIGLPHAGPDRAGVVRVVSGATRAVLYEIAGEEGEALGVSMAALGDLDGDGSDDFAIGASMPTPGRAGSRLAAIGYLGVSSIVTSLPAAGTAATPAPAPVTRRPGSVRVHSGADGSLLCRLDGKSPPELFGVRIHAVGDVDADGTIDLAVEAPGESGVGPDGDSWVGSVWIFSGASLAR